MPLTNFDPNAPPATDFAHRYIDAERTRRKHIAIEVSIKAIAVLYMISAAALIAAGGIAIVPAVKGAFAQSALLRLATDPAFIIGWLTAIAGAAFLSVGIGLRKFRPWARWIGIALAIFGIGSNFHSIQLLRASWLSLILPSIMLLALVWPGTGRVFSAPYLHTIDQTPHVRPHPAETILIALIVVLAIASTVASTTHTAPEWTTLREAWPR